MQGTRTHLIIPYGRWERIIPEEAAANDMGIGRFLWRLAELGFEVYRDQGGLDGSLKRENGE